MNIIILGCNGNIGTFITDNLANYPNSKIFALDMHKNYKGENKKVNYFKNNFIKNGLNNEIKKMISESNDLICFINLIAKDYPVTKSNSDLFLSQNSPFDLNLDEVCDSFRTTLGSSYLLLQEVMKLNNKHVHLILIGSIFSRNLPNPENYSDDGNIFKPVAYSLAKAAQNILFKEACRTLSCEKLRINMLTLGGVYTGQNNNFVEKYTSKVPMKKMVNLNDITDCLNWIIFKSPQVVNGCEFLVDGGWTLAN
tara:strand:- start:660 stop:1418 length:759 start_codon:yes stop_codon:yes gene_type:complete